MKKILIVLLAVAVLAAAGIALAGVSGTQHDVRVIANSSTLEPCAYCHTPHQGGISTYPLWNRTQTTPVSYGVYSSNTFNMEPANTSLDDGSAPCMVCHNGVLSTLVNYPGRGSSTQVAYELTIQNITNASGWANLGNDLQNEHPVSFTYNASLDTVALGGQGNNFPTSSNGTIPAIGFSFPLYKKSTDAAGTTGTQLGCATCHTVHHTPVSTYSAGSPPNQVYFLRVTNAGSAMCAACHRDRY